MRINIMKTTGNSTKFFEVTVKFKAIGDKGRVRKTTRKILVEAGGFGQAEAMTASAHPDYEITAIKLTKVHEVLSASSSGAQEGGHPAKVSFENAPGPAQTEEYGRVALPTPLTPLSDVGPKLNRAQRRALEREMARRAGKAALREWRSGVGR